MDTMTIDGIASAEELRAVEDPEARLRAASEAVNAIAERRKKLVDTRNAAGVQLYKTGVPAVKVWRETIEVARSMWSEDILPKVEPGKYDNPEQKAKGAVARIAELDALLPAVRQVRNDTARDLMAGKHGRPLYNREVIAITGMSSARVAQLRNTL